MTLYFFRNLKWIYLLCTSFRRRSAFGGTQFSGFICCCQCHRICTISRMRLVTIAIVIFISYFYLFSKVLFIHFYTTLHIHQCQHIFWQYRHTHTHTHIFCVRACARVRIRIFTLAYQNAFVVVTIQLMLHAHTHSHSKWINIIIHCGAEGARCACIKIYNFLFVFLITDYLSSPRWTLTSIALFTFIFQCFR